MTIAERLFAQRRAALVVLAVLAAAAGSMALVPAALGQGIDEYVDPGGGGGGNDDPNSDDGLGFGDGTGNLGAGDSTGDLPFTGYPLTPLVLVLLLLLAAGVLVRITIAVRDRMSAKTASPGSFDHFG